MKAHRLSKAKERECFIEYHKTKDMNKLEPVFSDLINYINFNIVKYRVHIFFHEDLEDIIANIYLHAVENLKNFDFSRGHRFCTYIQRACFWIIKQNTHELQSWRQKCNEGDITECIDETNVDDEVEIQRIMEKIPFILSKKVNKTRQVFQGLFIKGKSCSELAKELNTATQYIYIVKDRVLKEIRENLLNAV